MIFVDANILGSFAAVDRLDLVSQLFPRQKLCVAPAVVSELEAGIRAGKVFLSQLTTMLSDGRLARIDLSSEEEQHLYLLPSTLDQGEAESIAICRLRKATLLSNDRKALRHCRQNGIQCFDLVSILRALWRTGVCDERDVKQLISDMETTEGIVIRNIERIFDTPHEQD